MTAPVQSAPRVAGAPVAAAACSSTGWRCLRNAAGPVAAQIGLDLGLLPGGVVILEGIFSWTGVGKLAVDSIGSYDVPLIMVTVLFGTFWIVFANFAVDLVQAFLDPRIRVRGAG